MFKRRKRLTFKKALSPEPLALEGAQRSFKIVVRAIPIRYQEKIPLLIYCNFKKCFFLKYFFLAHYYVSSPITGSMII